MTSHELSPAGNAQLSAGGRVLSLLAIPLNSLILKELGEQPLRATELLERLGSPARSTLQHHLAILGRIDAITRRTRRGPPYEVRFELSPGGRDLLAVAEIVALWLERAPNGPIELGSQTAKGRIKALYSGWGSLMLPLMSSQPRSLTELDQLIDHLNYPALERRRAQLAAAGLIEAVHVPGISTPYTVTNWGHQGIGPLVAAARWERTHIPDTSTAITSLDAEAGLLLALPAVTVADDVTGNCALIVSMGASDKRLAGVTVAVANGTVSSCIAEFESRPRTWALGSVGAWLDATIDGRPDRLRMDGDRALAQMLVRSIHTQLFRS
jgi:DNA-binding HxlR family transcriptional regulator